MFTKIWEKFTSREAVSYIIFGVLTTLVDWITYAGLYAVGTDYRVSTALSWAAAVLFAFITNKFIVFRSFSMKPAFLWKEFSAFVTARVATGIFTMVAMIVMVDYLHWHEFVGKFMVSVISMVLNYILSKLFIFKKKADGGEEKNGSR